MTTFVIEFYDPKEAPYGVFSNYASSPIIIDGISYPTVEHYYQAEKFRGPEASQRSLDYATLISKQSTPNKARIFGLQKTGGGYKWRTDLNAAIIEYQDLTYRSDWEIVKEEVMHKALLAKFSTNPSLRKILLDTGNAEIREHTKRDFYWGDGYGKGQNRLGTLLMELRDSLHL